MESTSNKKALFITNILHWYGFLYIDTNLFFVTTYSIYGSNLV